MTYAAQVAIAADRYTPCVRTITFRGLDLTGVALRMQVRQNGDTPGAPMVDLQNVVNAQAQGLKLVSVDTVDGLPVSVVQIRINESTIKDASRFPFVGELGGASSFVYDLVGTLGGDKRVLMAGTFTLAPGVTGADNAPLDRPFGYGLPSTASGMRTGTTLTFGETRIDVAIDGADLLAPLAAQAQDALDRINEFTTGPAGGDANSYPTLALMQAAPISGLTYNLAAPSGSSEGVANGPFTYQAGDFTGRSDAVPLDGVPITVGALVRQSARGLSTTLNGEYFRSQEDLNSDNVSVKTFGAIGDGTAHPVAEWIGEHKRFLNLSALQIVYPHVQAETDSIDWAAIQLTIDRLAPTGGVAELPRGRYHLGGELNDKGEIIVPGRQIKMSSGVSLAGAGAHYEYKVGVGNQFKGSWIIGRALGTDAALLLRSVNYCSVKRLGIDMGEAALSVGIALGSDNNPATKELRFEDISIFGAYYAVQWGFGNALVAEEQCDSVTFDGGTTNSCVNGFLINAKNAADYSHIKRWSLLQMKGVGFDFIDAGFMKVEDCAMGSRDAETSILFRVTGDSPDTLRLIANQIEPVGRYLVASGSNDARTITIKASPINLSSEASGVLRINTEENTMTSKFSLSGFVRFRSKDDVWTGDTAVPVNIRRHAPQVVIGGGGVQFSARALKDATSFNGKNLPINFRIEITDAVPGGWGALVVSRAGIVTRPFYTGPAYAVDEYYRPTIDNGHAYIVTKGGTSGAEPTEWLTGNSAVVTSGDVIFKEVGPSAILKGCEPVEN